MELSEYTKTKDSFLTLDVLYHTVPHELHSDDQHNQIQFDVFCLITLSLNLGLFLPAPSPNKGIMNISLLQKKSATFLMNSYKYGVHT